MSELSTSSERTGPGLAAFEQLSSVIRARRTSMLVDANRDVPAEVIASLCELATWAPNHKKTWPWRFAAFSGDGRARLGYTMAYVMSAAEVGDDAKRTKTRGKYLRTPSILVVATAPHDNEMLDVENRDAVAAGIQNLLLGATTLGLASFWSTPAIASPRAVLELCGFEPNDRIVGIVYLGWADRAATVPERPPVELRIVDA